MTVPVAEIVQRKVPENIAPILDAHADLIEEFVNFGSHLLKWDDSPATKGEENVAPTMLFRHFLDLIDSISLLVRQGCGDTSKLLLRGALEVAFGLEYLFEKDTHDRAMAFLVVEIIKEIKTLKKFDISTSEGREMQRIFTEEGALAGAPNHGYNLAEEVAKKQSILESPEFDKAYQEYLRLYNGGEKKAAWYRFFNGPRNILDLAKHLRKQSFYELLYRKWSGAVHGSDIYLGKLTSSGDDGVDIVQLRFVKDVEEIVRFSLSLSLQVFYGFASGRIPHKKQEVAKWYLTIRDRYLNVSMRNSISVT